jgi:hypothetical protein
VILAGATFIVAPTLNLADDRDVPPLRRGGDARAASRRPKS